MTRFSNYEVPREATTVRSQSIMISIIICSVNSSRLNSLKENITATIGLPHEIIAIDNSNGQYGICAAYNLGEKKSRFPLLCFMHEDVIIETQNWGQLVCKHLSDRAVGLIGVAGGDAKSLVPSSWSIPVYSNEINIIQHYKDRNQEPKEVTTTRNQPKTEFSEVVVLDGVWLCTRKDVFQQNRFDEKMLRGFHGYDIDYSLQVGTLYKLLVIFDITLHHYSEGNPGKEWLDASIAISRKWKNHLPVSLYSDRKILREHHWKSMQVFLEHLQRIGLNPFVRMYFLVYYSCNRYFHPARFLSMCKYLLVSLVSTNGKR